jgi:hypothetical protein
MKAKEAIKLLDPIPADKFIHNEFGDDNSCCCVIGHLTRLKSDSPNDYSYLNCTDYHRHPLRRSSQEFIEAKHDVYSNIVDVNNDSNINGYTEDTVKERVMHLLKDMDDAGY